MKNLLACLLVALALSAPPATAQPWLDCAEKYLSKVPQEDYRQTYRLSLVHGYARNGEFAKAQALIDASGPDRSEVGATAVLGAVAGEHIDQALQWAELYIPASEPDWSLRDTMAEGSHRETMLRAARSAESATRLLEFLRARGGVSPSALAYVNRELGGLPVAVSDLYFREFAKMADQARPLDWVWLEESLEQSGEEFRPLANQVVEVLLTRGDEVLVTIAEPDSDMAQMKPRLNRYIASLLARQGRFAEAEALWAQAGTPETSELRDYLQNQYLGGRQSEALAALAKMAGMEEDARVQLSLFLLDLGHFEEVKALGTDPVEYIDGRIALRDLGRGKNVDKWLAWMAEQDTDGTRDSRLAQVAANREIPADVRARAVALISDPEAAREECRRTLDQQISKLKTVEPEKLTLMLLVLDEEIYNAGCSPGEASLKTITEL